jgi:hypothetical protein
MAQRPIHINLAVSDPKNIQAENDAAIISGIIGASAASASGILAFGNRMEMSKVDNNSVRISDGVYANQGFCLQIPDSEILTILSGSLGKMRIDLIVSEFRKGAERDSHEIKIIQGELFDSDPVAPTLTVEDLHGAGAVRQEEIGRVILTGTDITSVARTAPVLKGLTEIAGSIGNLSSLATSYKNDLVGAVNELQANNSLRVVDITSVPGQAHATAIAPYPLGFDQSNSTVLAIARSTLNGYAIVPYQVSPGVDGMHVTFMTVTGGDFTDVATRQVNVLFVKR